MKHEYWLYQDSEDTASKLMDFADTWCTWENSPFKQMWLRNYLSYYSAAVHPQDVDTSLIFEGVKGELLRFYTPKARSLIRQLTAVVTKQRLAFKASARISDSTILNELKIANALCEQIIDTQRLDLKGDGLCEGGLVTGIWFAKTSWRTDFGENYTRDKKGRIIKTGGIEVSILSPFNVFYNTMLPWDQQNWVMCRVKRNKWDLIAENPDFEDEIKQLPTVSDSRISTYAWLESRDFDDDYVYIYEFYHKPTPSLPKGRMMFFGDSKTVFYDDANTYEAIPIEPNIPETVLDSGLGYSKLTDLSGCQEMFDNNLSAIATNNSQFAVQNVAIARGSNVNVNQLGGMNFITFTPQDVPGGGKPEPLNLTKSAPETFKFTDKLEQLMQDLSYLNGAMTGNLPPGVSSGTAIATLSANSIEFITSISKSYNLCWENTMLHAVNAFSKFAKVPQQVRLTQKGGQTVYKSVLGEHVANVSGIQLETVNPLMKTFAGRLEIGEKLLSMPKEIWPEYVSIIEGRPFGEIYKGEIGESDLITQENEALENGQKIPVLATDDHPMHIKKHAEILADVGNRTNGRSVQATLDHMMEHYTQIKTADPVLLGIIQTGRIPEGGIPQPPPQPNQGGPSGLPPGMQVPGQDRPQAGSDQPQTVAPVVGDVAEPTPDLLGRS